MYFFLKIFKFKILKYDSQGHQVLWVPFLPWCALKKLPKCPTPGRRWVPWWRCQRRCRWCLRTGRRGSQAGTPSTPPWLRIVNGDDCDHPFIMIIWWHDNSCCAWTLVSYSCRSAWSPPSNQNLRIHKEEHWQWGFLSVVVRWLQMLK